MTVQLILLSLIACSSVLTAGALLWGFGIYKRQFGELGNSIKLSITELAETCKKMHDVR